MLAPARENRGADGHGAEELKERLRRRLKCRRRFPPPLAAVRPFTRGALPGGAMRGKGRRRGFASRILAVRLAEGGCSGIVTRLPAIVSGNVPTTPSGLAIRHSNATPSATAANCSLSAASRSRTHRTARGRSVAARLWPAPADVASVRCVAARSLQAERVRAGTGCAHMTASRPERRRAPCSSCPDT